MLVFLDNFSKADKQNAFVFVNCIVILEYGRLLEFHLHWTQATKMIVQKKEKSILK